MTQSVEPSSPSRPAVSLRAWLALSMGTLAALALGTAVGLIVLTGQLRGAVSSLGEAMNSVRVVDELDASLLDYSRLTHLVLLADDPRFVEERSRVERDLEELLVQARALVTSPDEATLLDDAEAKVRLYLQAKQQAEADGLGLEPMVRRVAQPLDEASRALGAFVAWNMAEVRETERRAARLNRLADVGGTVLAAVLLLGVLAVVAGERALVYRPLLAMRGAMFRFGAGERDVRSSETGAAELRDVAHTFNATADALGRQRETQLAFLAGVAHDLRNPLAAMKTASFAVRPDRPLPPEERVRRLFGVFTGQIDKLDRMIADLLDASRIEAGQLELRLEPHDLREVARTSVELYRQLSERHELVVRLPEEPLVVRCDAVRLEQVMNNLLSNAIKYSPEGGVVEVAGRREKGLAVLSVTDRGVGIPPAELPRIFEPFRRVGSMRESVPGVGLGLSVAQRIVRAHGGTIDVESALAEGTTFRVRLPLIADRRAPQRGGQRGARAAA